MLFLILFNMILLTSSFEYAMQSYDRASYFANIPSYMTEF